MYGLKAVYVRCFNPPPKLKLSLENSRAPRPDEACRSSMRKLARVCPGVCPGTTCKPGYILSHDAASDRYLVALDATHQLRLKRSNLRA